MSKVKKVLAIILSMAMILGMSLTAFAADKATIQVNNLEEGTTVTAAQVIKPSPTTDTGWEFVSPQIAEAYINAFSIMEVENAEQLAIWALIKYVDPDFSNVNVEVPDGVPSIDTEDIIAALTAVEDISDIYTISGNVNGTVATLEVSQAGVYAINAEAKEDSWTVYSPMAAYVAFTYTDGIPTLPSTPVEVNAKKTNVPIEKTDSDKDHAAGISDTIEYTISTSVPYGTLKDSWTITDTILRGAEYAVLPETDANAGKLEVKVYVDGEQQESFYVEPEKNASNQPTFTLNELANRAKNWDDGAKVELKYNVTVTGTIVENEVSYGDGENQSTENFVYTGSITFTKFAEDGKTKLGNAGFKVYRETSDGDKEYAIFEQQAGGSYQLKGWTTKENATQILTNNNSKDVKYGTLTVTGLDKGIYYFEETKAPDGYTINDNDEDVQLQIDKDGATGIFTAEGSMNDTALSKLPLPSTGGIGTTIFTIGGCSIMIAAAGLFFASRKKESK